MSSNFTGEGSLDGFPHPNISTILVKLPAGMVETKSQIRWAGAFPRSGQVLADACGLDRRAKESWKIFQAKINPPFVSYLTRKQKFYLKVYNLIHGTGRKLETWAWGRYVAA